MNPYISPVLTSYIEKHLYGNYLIKDTESPLIMGIFGPTGEGKTFQLEYVLNKLNIRIIDISGGELENENAGFPAEILRSEYKKASDANEPTVLVINDIDAIIGKWGNLTQYTVNRQNIYVQLMSFCDHPYEVAGHSTNRVPIFITGNNPSILYDPLKRPGRMRIVEWKPDINEKKAIVSRIFDTVDKNTIEKYVERYSDKPVSFWSDLKTVVWEDKMLEYLHSHFNPYDIYQKIKKGAKFSVSNIMISSDDLESGISKTQDLSEKSYMNQKNY